MQSSIEVGAVVLSKMGRDSGRYYVVVALTGEDYALVVDGKYKKLANPKLKKLKHLKYKGEDLVDIREELISNKEVTDAKIRRALGAYGTKKQEV